MPARGSSTGGWLGGPLLDGGDRDSENSADSDDGEAFASLGGEVAVGLLVGEGASDAQKLGGFFDGDEQFGHVSMVSSGRPPWAGWCLGGSERRA